MAMYKLHKGEDYVKYRKLLPSDETLQRMLDYIEALIADGMPEVSAYGSMKVWVKEGRGVERCYIPTHSGFIYYRRYFVDNPITGRVVQLAA